MNQIGSAMGSLQNLITLNGALGEYNIMLHLMVVAFGIVIIIGMAAAIVILRGENFTLVAICAKDILVGFGFAILVFTFPATFWFVGRAFWRAATWQITTEQHA